MDPTPPADGQPVTPADPQTAAGWLRQNAAQLVVVGALAVLVCNYLHPLDVLVAGFGLSLIIFLHELGHFAAAKLCDVHVTTFSIGFGPALPFCQFKYGETTYKLAMVPLGGYVAMVGEGDQDGDVVGGEDDPEAAAADPRSFKNKPVGQRMLIISAGVVMNVLLGGACFAATYLHGVEERPAILAGIEPGSAAWRAGLHEGTQVTRLNDRDDPWFADIQPVVFSTRKGETVRLEVEYQGKRDVLAVEPLRQEGSPSPMLGVRPPEKMTLRSSRRSDAPPYPPGGPLAAATAPDGGPGFLPGDAVVAMTDPADPGRVTPLDPGWNGLPGPVFDYDRRLLDLAGKPVTFHVVRKAGGDPVPVRVGPAYRKDVGLRMRMGQVAAVRRGSPAERAGVRARPADGAPGEAAGDQIVAVQVPEADGSVTTWSFDRTDAGAKPLDPARLPWELTWWADRRPAGGKVKVTVLRAGDHTEKREPLEMDWDPAWRYEASDVGGAATPVAVNGLGLAYHVQAVVDAVAPGSPAAAAGLQPNDKVTQVRFKSVDHKGKETAGAWEDVQPHHWGFVDALLQRAAPHAFDLRVERAGGTVEVGLAAVDDPTWPAPVRGLALTDDTRTQKAAGLLDALEMGAHRTARSIRMIYQQLYSLAAGRVSVKLMSGPITLARFSYLIAGEDVWHLLIWLGLISINLAVVNFLPIPVLDGGHMVFLVYEWARGKPAPVPVQAALTYLGLAVVGCLMLFVLGLDIWRLL